MTNDIVDSIDEQAYIPFNRQMKNELYKIARLNYKDFLRLLLQYDYPNIAPEKIASFYQQIIDFIDEQEGELPFEIEFLRQGLKTARMQGKLAFLQDNQERTVIDSYFPFYVRPIGLFSSAQHIFDREDQIEKQFSKYVFFHEGEKATVNAKMDLSHFG
mgnify:CR=1 FL=1